MIENHSAFRFIFPRPHSPRDRKTPFVASERLRQGGFPVFRGYSFVECASAARLYMYTQTVMTSSEIVPAKPPVPLNDGLPPATKYRQEDETTTPLTADVTRRDRVSLNIASNRKDSNMNQTYATAIDGRAYPLNSITGSHHVAHTVPIAMFFTGRPHRSRRFRNPLHATSLPSAKIVLYVKPATNAKPTEKR